MALCVILQKNVLLGGETFQKNTKQLLHAHGRTKVPFLKKVYNEMKNEKHKKLQRLQHGQKTVLLPTLSLCPTEQQTSRKHTGASNTLNWLQSTSKAEYLS